MTASTDLARVLAGRGPILLDFDGPVCSVFAGYPAADVAAQLRELLETGGSELPPAVAGESDPLEVLRWAGSHGAPGLVRRVEEALCRAELAAVRSAAPTSYAREVIVTAREAGKVVGVVSNNSSSAINEYLTRHRLRGHVAVVVGRAYAEPDRMKPNPEPVSRLVRALGANPSECVLIGDSVSDIEAAHAARVQVIGFANRPAKSQLFMQAGVDVIVTSMADVARALMEVESVGGVEQ